LHKPVGRIEHPHYPLIQGFLLVLFIPVSRLVLRLPYAILFICYRYPAILPRGSLVILSGAPSTYYAREGDE